MDNILLELAKQIWPNPEISHVNHMKFAALVAEECANIAEVQSRIYTGEHNEGAGCYRAAHAIRVFANTIGANNE